jgi:cyclopropane fatty-acyl-phospholipid synthase-like methyltransferase
MTDDRTRCARPTIDPRELYSQKLDLYVRFIRAVGYPRGLLAYFANAAFLRDDMRVLDAGCGTGVVTLALRRALLARGLRAGLMHAFDLTPAMLERFRSTIRTRGIDGIELVQCDVLDLSALPAGWDHYDLIVSASMMEYLPRARLADALSGLRSRLAPAATFVLFITRRNWLTRPLIGRWWDSNLYSSDELGHAFREAGFGSVSFGSFPAAVRYLGLWGHIVEARAGA